MVNNGEKALRRLLEIARFAAENPGFACAISGTAIAKLGLQAAILNFATENVEVAVAEAGFAVT